MNRNRTKRGWSRLMLAVVVVTPVLVAGGCQSQSNHEQNVNAANDRWLQTRSSMMLELAQQQFDTGDLDNASRTVRDAMAMDPSNARLQVLAGRISLERGQLERAYHLFQAAIALDDTASEAHYYKGLVLQRWQRHDRAHESYKRAYEITPDDAGYLMAAAEMLVEIDRLEEGIAMLEGQLNYFDQNAAIRAALAHLHAMNGRPDLAVTYFRRASLLDPDNDKLREDLALTQIASGQMEDAIRTLESLLKKEEFSGRRGLRLALARAYEEIGQDAQAREQYLRLARGERAEGRDWIRLAEISWGEGDTNGTLYAANRAIELSPGRHEGYLFAGLAWQQRDRLDDALKMFDRAADLAPSEASPLILRGIALQRAGQRAAAAEAYEKALERQPDDHRAQRLLSQVAGAQ
ncbi:tetratricopeptide repeat protein [Phycisphaerales bacterium AB-hyl4]|uniref:Tetratricopeptide repeat protein n=1 Tax=Natronomicrosphaera hydrolytica TaxID=3242702 RepID=A0ABV4U9H4_9BACT